MFLHPQTHEEYALARTERKTARGYHGFEFHAAPDVTLEQDLARRDLTINAIAKDADGRIIDPFNGVRDLKAGVLRHVSPAFAEDPVRILRVARFAARFPFNIAPGDAGADARRWRRTARPTRWSPSACGRSSRADSWKRSPRACSRCCTKAARSRTCCRRSRCSTGTPERAAAAMRLLDAAARQDATLEVRFAVLARVLDPLALESLAHRLKLPAACRDLALLAARHANLIADAQELDAAELLELLDAADAWRRPERFAELVDAALVGRGNGAAQARAAAREGARRRRGGRRRRDREAGEDPAEIRERIDEARLEAIRDALKERD